MFYMLSFMTIKVEFLENGIRNYLLHTSYYSNAPLGYKKNVNNLTDRAVKLSHPKFRKKS